MSFHLAQPMEVRLVEASPLTGGLIFSPVLPGSPAPAASKPRTRSR